MIFASFINERWLFKLVEEDEMRILLMLLATIAPAGLAFAWTTDWPMSRGNSSSSGSVVSQPLHDTLDVLWEYKIKGLGFDSGPIIADSTVFAADADGNVVALKLDSGVELWKKKFDTSFLASPSFSEGILYIGDTDGMLRALNAKTGEAIWEFNAKREIDAGANFYGDNVLVTSQSGSLFAVSKKDGKLQWEYETGDQLQCGPSLAGKLTFLGGCDQHLHIIDVESGKAAAEKISLEAPTGSTPSVSGSTVLVPTYKGQIWAFESPSNKLLWKFDDQSLASEFKNSVAIADGIVIANSGSRNVFALELATGNLIWKKSIKRRSDSSPVIAGNQIIIAGADGRVARFDLKTGSEFPVVELKGAFLGSPAVDNGKVVLASDRGDIFCLGAK